MRHSVLAARMLKQATRSLPSHLPSALHAHPSHACRQLLEELAPSEQLEDHYLRWRLLAEAAAVATTAAASTTAASAADGAAKGADTKERVREGSETATETPAGAVAAAAGAAAAAAPFANAAAAQERSHAHEHERNNWRTNTLRRRCPCRLRT
jgi:hypothetical protein